MVDLFSPEFCAEFYRERYRDLANHSVFELKEHFEMHGRCEGRTASPMATREGFSGALQGVSTGLEIGPFNKPVLRFEGAKFFDVLSTYDLQQHAVSIDECPDGVPDIDFLSRDGDLSIVLDSFDLVFSSHCIEHQPDLVKHLKHVDRLLNNGGVYAVIIPDCRFCFDHFLPASHIGEVVEAHLEERTVHRLAKIIEHRAMTTHNDSMRHWKGDHGQPGPNLSTLRNAVSKWEAANGGYIDVHAWQFTPESFRAIIRALNDLGLVSLRTLRVYTTAFGSNEFCAVLARP